MPNSKKNTPMHVSHEQKQRVERCFEDLRDRLCRKLEHIDATRAKTNPPVLFTFTPWQRTDKHNPDNTDAGGGVMGILYGGHVFEKAAVHISTVKGTLNPNIMEKFGATGTMQKDATQPFWSTGISVIIHPRNPNMPTAHMNTRFFDAGSWWFGGGADLTPMINTQRHADKPQSKHFINAMTRICRKYTPENTQKYKQWCDTYFFLPHRNEMRGIGGIFYDHHNSGDWEQDFQFTRAVGIAFVNAYETIIRRNIHKKWTKKQQNEQYIQRGRYAEFNLLYDRGTKFGLEVGGNIDAIFSSLPPIAKWI